MTDDDYLWDGSGVPDETVMRLERALASQRFQPSAVPWRAQAPRGWRGLAVAAAVLLSLGSALIAGHQWRLAWPAGAAWAVADNDGETAWLTVGQHWRTERTVEVQVARIGTLTVAPATQLMLEATEARRHQLRLERGALSVRVFAPPGTVRVNTPAGLVTDLGCVFEVSADDRETRVVVRSGWVELENSHGATLVPAGASSRMTPHRAPATPVFLDASPAFAAAVATVDEDWPVDRAADLRMARARDAVSLLVLASRRHGPDRAALIALVASVSPPPLDVDAAAVSIDDDAGLWRWHAALPLPPPKQWWRNWRDGLSGAGSVFTPR